MKGLVEKHTSIWAALRCFSYGVLALSASNQVTLAQTKEASDALGCDLLASAPYDMGRQAAGVCYPNIEVGLALESCEYAVAVDPSNLRSRFQLGRAQLIARQTESGLNNLKSAAADGYAAAMVGLALHYEEMDDFKEVFSWAQGAAVAGNPVGQYLLGKLYLLGNGVNEDRQLAYKWIESAANAGEPISKYRLSRFYAVGELVPKDMRRSRALLTEAAESGVPIAQMQLGQLFENERGADNHSKAREWYKRAAQGGAPQARVSYAALLMLGEGGEDDDRLAFEQLHLAALSGHVGSQYFLSLSYETGRGTEPNLVEAYFWTLVAAKGGDEMARYRGFALADKLPRDVVNTQRQRADRFKVPVSSKSEVIADYCYDIPR